MNRKNLLFILLLALLLTGCKTKETILSELILKKDFHAVEDFLNRNNTGLTDSNLDENGKTAMHVAVEIGNRDIINLLLRNNYSLTLTDRSGKYPVSYCTDKSTKTYLMALINKALIDACYAGNLADVKKLLASGADNNFRSDENTTPLHAAIEGNQYEVYTYLKEQGANLQQRGQNDGTILHTALLYEGENTYKIVEDIISSGFDVNLTDWNSYTPLFYPVKNPLITKLLIDQNANVNIRDKEGCYPIHYIVRDETVESVKLLLQYGADINAKDKQGNTPLHYCGSFYNNDFCQNGDVIQFLITQGALLNAKNIFGIAPLHIFASGMYDNGTTHEETLHSNGNPKGVELMLQAGAAIDITDNHGRTPLYFAVESGNLPVARLLIHNGAKKDIKATDGTTPLHIARSYKYKELVKLLQ